MAKKRNFDEDLQEVLAACPELTSPVSPILIICQPDRVMVPVSAAVLADFKKEFRYWQRHMDKALRAYMVAKKKET